jgi:hypothetical protein
MRDFDIEDLGIDLEPYNEGTDSPDKVAQKTMAWVTQVATPLSAAAQAQGSSLDAAEIIRRVGMLMGVKDVDVLFVGGNQGVPFDAAAPGGEEGGPQSPGGRIVVNARPRPQARVVAKPQPSATPSGVPSLP